jgi:hypothetical protein
MQRKSPVGRNVGRGASPLDTWGLPPSMYGGFPPRCRRRSAVQQLTINNEQLYNKQFRDAMKRLETEFTGLTPLSEL